MNSKQVTALVVIAAAFGFWLVGVSSHGQKPPKPKPDPDPIPANVVSQEAASSAATFINALGDVQLEASKKVKAGDFKTVKEYQLWVKAADDDVRGKAFQSWYTALDAAKKADKEADSLKLLGPASEQSAAGFYAQAKGACK